MKTLTVFDPAMCCSTGVCGSDVDQVLVGFSADVQWLKGREFRSIVTTPGATADELCSE